MQRRRYLVTYDIREPTRLRRVHQTMKGFGDPLQYSVFVCDLNRAELLLLHTKLEPWLKMDEDSVMFVDLGDPVTTAPNRFSFLGPRPSFPSSAPPVL